MSRHQYTTLIEEFCKLTGIIDPDAVTRGATVETSDIRFSLVHLEQANPELLFIYSDFADTPADDDIERYRTLLKRNLSLYSSDGPIFALSPDTGNVVLAKHEKLAGLRADVLADKLISLASTIHEWRQELFGEVDGQRHARVKPQSKEPFSPRMRVKS